jgi:hypothetical protein
MRATVRYDGFMALVTRASSCSWYDYVRTGRVTERQRLERETVTVENDVPEVPTDESGEHFKPTGTIFVITVFVATMILLWGSVYVILLSRGVTVQ